MSPTFPTAAAPALILEGCAYTVLQTLPANSIDCIITSPPYWGLRDYGIAPTDWPACSYTPMPGLPPIEVPAETSCLGLEPTLHAFLSHITLIFDECRRVLKPTGSCWVNMGDSYASDAGGYDETGSRGATAHKTISRHTQAAVQKGKTRKPQHGLKPKDLIGQPWRVAFALQASGWYLRQDNIWHKPNPMPESIRDRATKSHEYIFHLTKQERYYFDLAAWAEPASGRDPGNTSHKDVTAYVNGDESHRTKGGLLNYAAKAKEASKRNSFARVTKDSAGEHGQTPQFRPDREVVDYSLTRNKRSVWTVPTCAYAEAHYATYPPHLITPPMLATTSAKGCCSMCGKPWERIVEKTNTPNPSFNGSSFDTGKTSTRPTYNIASTQKGERFVKQPTDHWQPTCMCSQSFTDPITVQPAIVLDIFGGSGTTAQVALEHGRHAILIERGPHNIALIHKRLTSTLASPVLPLA